MSLTYPIIQHPSSNIVCQLPALDNVKRCKKGPIEIVALSCARELGLDCIYNNVRVNICGHYYEPDLVFINRDKKICIDIEIDEPYSASGHPTHFIENGVFKDAIRNSNFTQKGWYVIRFSEKQIFTQTKSCMMEVYKLALLAGAIDKLPSAFARVSDISIDLCWTKDESLKYRTERYRESYLGMDPRHFYIKYVPQYLRIGLPILRQAVFDNGIRKEIYRSVVSYFF